MVMQKLVLMFICLMQIFFCHRQPKVFAYSFPEAEVTVRVMDEQGMPMENVEVLVGFQGSHGKGKVVKVRTDAKGNCTASNGTAGIISFRVLKDGYYETYNEYRFTKLESDKWLPWNPEIQLVLRKIIHPVPMYARDTIDTRLQIPIVGKEVGFDLIEYDWVAPYGKGKHADFIFNLDRKFESEDKFEIGLILTFPNKYDGIYLVKEDRRFGSQLKLPRKAPKSGYKKNLLLIKKRIPGKGIEENYHEDNNYIFRVRSEEKDKRLARAMYGKIHGDIRVDPRGSKTAVIMFKYYLNPDYTVNLEYDSSQNLFTNLRDRRKLDWVGLE